MPEFLAPVVTQTVQPTPISVPVPPIFDLSNGIWQGIGALFGLAAIIVSFVFWWTARQRKQLSYQVVSDTPLVSVREEAELKGRLKVLFDDVPAQDLDLRAVIVRLSNSGNVPIGEDDYFGHPIEIQFGENAEVLTTNVIKTGPDDFEVKATPSGTKALFHPVLLNMGQFVEVKALVKQATDFRFYAHIRGVQIRNFGDGNIPTRSIPATLAIVVAIMLTVIIGMVITVSLIEMITRTIDPLVLLTFILVGIGVFLFLVIRRT